LAQKPISGAPTLLAAAPAAVEAAAALPGGTAPGIWAWRVTVKLTSEASATSHEKERMSILLPNRRHPLSPSTSVIEFADLEGFADFRSPA
jgi:hypothetical protein